MKIRKKIIKWLAIFIAVFFLLSTLAGSILLYLDLDGDGAEQQQGEDLSPYAEEEKYGEEDEQDQQDQQEILEFELQEEMEEESYTWDVEELEGMELDLDVD